MLLNRSCARNLPIHIVWSPDSCSKNCDPFKRLVLLHPVLLADRKTSCPNLPNAFTEEAKIMTREARNVPINHQPNFGSCLFSCCQMREVFSKGLVHMRCANADLSCTLCCSPLSYIAKDKLDSGGGLWLPSFDHPWFSSCSPGSTATAVELCSKNNYQAVFKNRSILLCCQPLSGL